MQYIITTIGSWGVRTESRSGRLTDPQPGDVVDFGEEQGNYPFDAARYGRIERVGIDTVIVCCNSDSVFLMETGEVSIRGGPFANIPLSQLEPTSTLKAVRFWNWGDCRPSTGHGVDYLIERPVFMFRVQKEEGKP